ncbi:MAG: GDP-mannose 4,6-dehydratase [Limisphaerales bacterium]
MPKALITGVTGQDGSYLTEFLLAKGYEVHGVVRRIDTLEHSAIAPLCRDPKIYNQRLFIHSADLVDPAALQAAVSNAAPDEIYHLAGQTDVARSFEIPEVTCDVVAMGTLRLLEMARAMSTPPKFFHASSSEIFGIPATSPQTLETPVSPVNPYGCAKVFATQMVQVYRRSFGLFACNGILYNHESPRRGKNFVTRKICRAAALIKLGRQKELFLGDTSAKRDWGHSKDYVRGMWMVLQHSAAEDFIFATGTLHSVQDVVEIAFASLDLDWQAHVKRDERLIRPTESHSLVGDPSKARTVLGWQREYRFPDIIHEMTAAELESLKSGPN